ncbi:preprotein translocase subunit YajC [Clostridium chauvoei]|uniref:Preprotein translocase subunit YajC n=2 Tax=Clostridium chauvoei TaxID=46867 RepID=A0ABD4RGS4_9CLOT|nr:preprotein translocase subunit YajC [Clostridium chauvoei]ATD55786.1 preprotein translocase subunit YajC [Clostridium chauvoei]ATD56539.1 preprotein translocase subunit YajC [Clostridium chauvoei]MBX7280332.1 preprotein translocase subunit YajC [Clostridium chauvoei]MBX7282817.1 preprotein translocase subunit YajC [Clostridium chauvoei]MBX7285223.1 preprotein translocase subunit YajC [Clostridium chauvoei]
MSNWLIGVIIFLAAYPIIISMIMPTINRKKLQKQEEQREEYLNTLRVKDRVVTISGIYGTIKGIHNNIVRLEVAKNVEIEIDKASIMGSLK